MEKYFVEMNTFPYRRPGVIGRIVGQTPTGYIVAYGDEEIEQPASAGYTAENMKDAQRLVREANRTN